MNSRIGFVETPLEIARLMVRLASVDKNSLVLDTGFGRGVFLHVLKEEGFTNVWGIEIDKELYSYCKNIFKEFKLILGDFLTYPFNHKFDLIIGNPPYAHFNQLPQDIANNVKKIIGTSEGDIYYAFIIRSVSLLKDGGELIYIVPYHFFYNTYAKTVRDTLLKFGKIEVIIDLNEVKIFKGENPEIIIFKFRKGKYNLKNEKIKILRIKTRKATINEIYNEAIEALNNRRSNRLFDYCEYPHYTSSDHWSSYLFDIPDFPSIRLKDIARVGVGLVSGYDKAFIISKEEIAKFNDEEIKLVKKFVKARHCRRFIVDGYTEYIVIDDSIKSEEQLKKLYPNIYRKILPFKNEMSRRYLPTGKKWFHWQALRNYNFLIHNLDKKRIYVPALDRHPYNRFSLGEEGLLPSGDVLFIQPNREEDLYFLLGYLNSSFFRKYYLTKGSRRGERISFTQRLLENAEIPLFSDEVIKRVISITKEIVAKLKRREDTSNLEKELDDLIYSAIRNRKFKSKLKLLTYNFK